MRNIFLNLTLAGAIGATIVGCSGKASELGKNSASTGAALPSKPQPAEVTDVSLIQLVATPERFHGKFVRVIGHVRLEFEGNAIYLHHDDLKYGLTKNGLWLDVTDQIRKERDKYTDKYVLVEGTFNSQNHGHMGMNSGAIESIKRFQAWAERKGE
jgi:hypothetical protein